MNQFPELLDRITPLRRVLNDRLANAMTKNVLIQERIYRDVKARHRDMLAGSKCPVEDALVSVVVHGELAVQLALKRMTTAGDSAACRNFAQVHAHCQKAYLQSLKYLEEFRYRRSFLADQAKQAQQRQARALPNSNSVGSDAEPVVDGVPTSTGTTDTGTPSPESSPITVNCPEV